MNWVIVLGWVLVFALPISVIIAAILWPERIPPDRTVDAIRERVEAERRRDANGGNGFRRQGLNGPPRRPAREPRQDKPRGA